MLAYKRSVKNIHCRRNGKVDNAHTEAADMTTPKHRTGNSHINTNHDTSKMQHTCGAKLHNNRSNGKNGCMHQLRGIKKPDAHEGLQHQLLLTLIASATTPRSSSYSERAHVCLSIWCTWNLRCKGQLQMSANARHRQQRQGNCQQALNKQAVRTSWWHGVNCGNQI